MRCAVLFLCLISTGLPGSKSENEDENIRVVKTAQGAVRGQRDPETGVFAFYSIPYATAPVGHQRFKAPLPGPTWLQPLDAIDKGIVCPQFPNPLVASKKMQDDCLIANVYVPDTKNKKLPVAVYVHGGAFQIGYGDMAKPLNFVKNKNLIAVTFNYRLGINGFLCLGTKETPGNAGLKDQLTLLRWVKRNIASFGGNPDEVTIIGGSAGAVSVDLLMLSKTTKGLFNKVILESGASVGVIALQVDPLENAKNHAISLGFTDIDNIYGLERFFKETSLDILTSTKLFNPNSTFGFTPCFERDTGSEVFLDDTPINILKNKKYRKVPMLVGFDNMEGIFQTPNFNTWKDKMNEKFSDFLPADLKFESEIEKENVGKTVKQHYFGDQAIDENTILGYVDFFTDIQFSYAMLLSVKLHVEAGHDQIYLYEYSFVDEDTPVIPNTNVRGASHCAQTIHVLDGRKSLNPNDVNMSDDYIKMRDVMQELWYNFINTGKPVPENSALPQWPPVEADYSPHMSLGVQVVLQHGTFKTQERAQFWDAIYSKYYRTPISPPTPPPEPHYEL